MHHLLFVFLMALTAPQSIPESSVYYKVIGVSDGDTFTVLSNKQPIKIRLEGIDAPEKGMPFCNASRKHLSDLCFGKFVKLRVYKTDRYGRLVARAIRPDGLDISAEMIRAGMAWHYVKYSSDKKLALLESQGRKAGTGLWKDPNARPPWEIRKIRRSGRSTKEMMSKKMQK